MIKQETVFVIGAGASMPFGFPSGERLLELVCQGLQSEDHFNQLQNVGFSKEEIIAYQKALFNSGRTSVDQFLEHRLDLIDIGKHSIAQVLIGYESSNSLFGMGSSGNWYKYLFGIMNSSFERFHENKISFITFNYDRSLEQFLFLALKNSYGKSDIEVAEKLKSLNIVHVHGQLGDLPLLGANTRNYDTVRTKTSIEQAAAQIRIIHEGIDADEDEQFVRAQKLIRKAKRVFFLGFGYHPVNLSRLNINDSKATFYGTAMGLSLHERAAIQHITLDRISHTNLHDTDIISLFRAHQPLN